MSKTLTNPLAERWLVREPEFGEVQIVLDDCDWDDRTNSTRQTVLATIEDMPGDVAVARLMAAAPAMRDALRAIVEATQSSVPDAEAANRASELAHAALALTEPKP